MPMPSRTTTISVPKAYTDEPITIASSRAQTNSKPTAANPDRPNANKSKTSTRDVSTASAGAAPGLATRDQTASDIPLTSRFNVPANAAVHVRPSAGSNLYVARAAPAAAPSVFQP